MDPTDFRVRLVSLRLEMLRHQVGLRHSDLQRRFVFGLTVGGSVVLSFLRAELPPWGSLAEAPPFAWAAFEMSRIRRLSEQEDLEAELLLRSLIPGPETSRADEVHDP